MQMMISDRMVGDDCPVFFIAEAGVNHNGSTELGVELVDAAAEAGVDAVKFQTFKAKNLNVRTAPKSSYHVQTTGSDAEQTWYELLKTQEMSPEMHQRLMERCREKNIIFLSTPYDPWSADLLEQLGVAAYKLASTDTTNLPLIRHIARKGAPFVISTAMCSMDDVRAAVNAIRAEGLEDFAVLQCTGNYPARLEDANLRVMETYRRELGCLVGYSDHTPELVNPIAATAMGACIYEKHFTLDKNLPGPDHRMSLSPQELKATVEAIRQTEQALGSAEKFVLPSEKENSLKLRKSLVAARRLRAGETLSEAMLLAKRPGSGVSPSRLDELIGRRLIRDLEEDALIQWEDVE